MKTAKIGQGRQQEEQRQTRAAAAPGARGRGGRGGRRLDLGAGRGHEPEPLDDLHARQLSEQAARQRQLAAAQTGADDDLRLGQHGGVDQHRPARGQPDRGDRAVLHAGALHRGVHRQEAGLADVDQGAHRRVDVGARRGEHHAGRDALLAGALAADDDAVGAGLQRHAGGLDEGGRVGDGRVDRHHGHLLGAGPGQQRLCHRGGDEVQVLQDREVFQGRRAHAA